MQRHISSRFVSVTQQFNTATSMGRLVLNVLLSFAQFEREMISERTREKMAAARRKGRYVGGRPILGYDVVDTKLVVNEDEAERVRQVFELYLQHQSPLPVVKELGRRGWTTKRCTARGGQPLTKNRLYQLLTNLAYIGKVRYKGEIHQGEHQAIVDQEVFRQVQAALKRNGRGGGARNKHGALLRGLLRCASCGCGMAPTYTTKGQRRYRYYICVQAQQRGWQTCPAPSVPAGEIERFILDQIKCIGRKRTLRAEVLRQAQEQFEAERAELVTEERGLKRELGWRHAELRRLAGDAAAPAPNQMAELHDRIAQCETRLREVQHQLQQHERDRLTAADIDAALADFDGVWNTLSPRERAQLVALLVTRVEFDAAQSTVAVSFHPTAIKALARKQPAGAA